MIDLIIPPRETDLGGLIVRRVLPFRQRRSVGPFVFFDQMGRAEFPAGKGIDVRPHPHIGLATITYLYEGIIQHKDSLGFDQPIRPGEVNWMTAGRGIVHSERTPQDERAKDSILSGIQAWIALPQDQAEVEPSFTHHPSEDLPEWDVDGTAFRLIAGHFMGNASPVKTHSEMVYADVRMDKGSRFNLPSEHEELAVHVSEGAADVDGRRLEAGHMAVLSSATDNLIEAAVDTRLMILGGAPLDGPRTIWWNFVSHSKDRIEQAKDDWKNNRFDPVPGETEFIPLPE